MKRQLAKAVPPSCWSVPSRSRAGSSGLAGGQLGARAEGGSVRTHRSSDSAERALPEHRALQGRRRAGQHTTATAFPGALAQPQYRLPGLPGCRPLSLPNLQAEERSPHASSPFPWALALEMGTVSLSGEVRVSCHKRPRQELRGCAGNVAQARQIRWRGRTGRRVLEEWAGPSPGTQSPGFWTEGFALGIFEHSCWKPGPCSYAQVNPGLRSMLLIVEILQSQASCIKGPAHLHTKAVKEKPD